MMTERFFCVVLPCDGDFCYICISLEKGMGYWMKRIGVWCLRWRHSRGFGVQSPWAYRMLRYVINEHYPYYAYEELQRLYGGEGRRRLKLGRLYLRIANAVQPQVVVDYGSSSHIYRDFVRAGCRRSRVLRITGGHDRDAFARTLYDIYSIDMLRLSFVKGWRELLEVAMQKTTPRSVFVFEGIYDSRETRLFWQQFVRDERVGITFDLYYCGIAFFDRSMVKQHYMVNF